MASALDDALDPARIRALTNEFCTAFPDRTAGGSGEEAAARFTADRMRAAGLESVTVTPVEFSIERASSWELRGPDGRARTCRPLLGVAPCRDLEIPVVDVGLGAAEDYARLRAAGVQLDGSAHLAWRGGNGPGTDEVDRFEKIHNAKVNGAAAFLYAMDVAAGPREWLPEGAGAPPPMECGLGDLSPTLPALTLAAAGAENLPRARITVEAAEQAGTSWLVTGTLPGAGGDAAGAEEVILGAQLDAVEWARHGAPYDNGAGVAAVLLLAEAFAAAGGRRRTLRVCAFGAEEVGTIASRHLAADRMDAPERVAAMVNLDSWTHREGFCGISSYGRGAMGDGDFSRGAPYGGVVDTEAEGSLARRFMAALETVGYPADRRYFCRRGEWTSDHYPFAIVGIPSLWAFKKPVLFHCEYDALGAMDWEDASRIARAHGLLLEDLLSAR